MDWLWLWYWFLLWLPDLQLLVDQMRRVHAA